MYADVSEVFADVSKIYADVGSCRAEGEFTLFRVCLWCGLDVFRGSLFLVTYFKFQINTSNTKVAISIKTCVQANPTSLSRNASSVFKWQLFLCINLDIS